jgi:hypothetical protein
LTAARRTADLQRAIDFFSSLEAATVEWSRLPDRPDYAAIALIARESGIELEETALREAFRLMMQARRLASDTGSGGTREI